MTEVPSPREALYIEHMLGAIAKIRQYVGRKRRASFMRSRLLQDAVMRNLLVIGEAASQVSAEFAARHAKVPWRDIVGMRHRLVHGYSKVKLDVVWTVVARDLPVLQQRLREIASASQLRARRKRRA